MAVTDPPNPIGLEKRALRDEVLAVRSELGPSITRSAGLAALAHVGSDARWRAARCIGLFASTANEPSTPPFLDAIVASGRTALFPRCIDGHRLEFASVTAWDELRPGRYGLAEPVSAAREEPWHFGDLVLVPGVAFDLGGGRLGRGGGYFDRSFSDRVTGTPWLLGLALELQIVERVPMESFDRRVDGIVTEMGIRWFGDGRWAAR